MRASGRDEISRLSPLRHERHEPADDESTYKPNHSRRYLRSEE